MLQLRPLINWVLIRIFSEFCEWSDAYRKVFHLCISQTSLNSNCTMGSVIGQATERCYYHIGRKFSSSWRKREDLTAIQKSLSENLNVELSLDKAPSPEHRSFEKECDRINLSKLLSIKSSPHSAKKSLTISQQLLNYPSSCLSLKIYRTMIELSSEKYWFRNFANCRTGLFLEHICENRSTFSPRWNWCLPVNANFPLVNWFLW